MELTNQFNYPSAVVAMATASIQRPDANALRVTSLIAPPAIRYYQLHKWDDIVVDVDDFLLSNFGTAWHQYLSKFAPGIQGGGYYVEQTLQMSHAGYVITGTPDIRSEEGGIVDYKTTSAWSFVFSKPEWEYQLNMYALLAEANGFPVRQLTINAFLRDWNAKNVLQYGGDYPPRPFHQVHIPLWSLDKRKEFASARIADHKAGLRPCTPEERWQKQTTWAVMKPNVKRAVRVFESENEAGQYASKNNAVYFVQCRPGSCRRCEDYCIARSVCQFRDNT